MHLITEEKDVYTLRNASFTRASVINPFFHMFSINAVFESPLHVHAMLMLNSCLFCVSRLEVCPKQRGSRDERWNDFLIKATVTVAAGMKQIQVEVIDLCRFGNIVTREGMGCR